jgi:hypothetical protein
MAIPYTQTTMANVRAVDGTYISYPFLEDGDTSTKVYNMICTQRESDYSASQIDLDDPMTNATTAGVIELPFTGDSSAYFVGDTGHSSIGGGMIQFTRTFSNIPQTITTPSGSAFVTFPGIWKERTAGTTLTINGVTMTAGARGVTISTQAVHGLSIYDNVNISLNYKVGIDPFIYSVSGDFRVLGIQSTQSFRVDIGHYWDSQVTLVLDGGTAIEGQPYREQISKNVSTLTRYDYILPGTSPGVSDILDVNVPPAFSVITRDAGTISDRVSDGETFTPTGGTEQTYSTTMPSATDYLDMIKDEKNIIIEASLSEWAGNILVMKTKTCKTK